MFTARKKIAKEAGAEPTELEEQVAQVRRGVGSGQPPLRRAGHAAAWGGSDPKGSCQAELPQQCRSTQGSASAVAAR